MFWSLRHSEVNLYFPPLRKEMFRMRHVFCRTTRLVSGRFYSRLQEDGNNSRMSLTFIRSPASFSAPEHYTYFARERQSNCSE